MHQTAQPCTKARFPITRRQSHGFISPEIKATILYHQPSQPWFRSPDNTVMFSVTRHQRHCFISSDATAMGLSIPWFHSPDAKATVSFTRHHSHGFIHQIRQPRLFHQTRQSRLHSPAKGPGVLRGNRPKILRDTSPGVLRSASHGFFRRRSLSKSLVIQWQRLGMQVKQNSPGC